MREIIFRGKRTDNGEWVEGSYLHLNVGKDYICDGTVWVGTLNPCKYQIDQATIGQFTGLKDKYGKMIFEGDIVRVDDDIYDIHFVGHVSHKYAPFVVVGENLDVTIYALGDYEIESIGNIHDNPDLLKGNDYA